MWATKTFPFQDDVSSLQKMTKPQGGRTSQCADMQGLGQHELKFFRRILINYTCIA